MEREYGRGLSGSWGLWIREYNGTALVFFGKGVQAGHVWNYGMNERMSERASKHSQCSYEIGTCVKLRTPEGFY